MTDTKDIIKQNVKAELQLQQEQLLSKSMMITNQLKTIDEQASLGTELVSVYLDPIAKTNPFGAFNDPYAALQMPGYTTKPSQMSFKLLRSMAKKTEPVSAIIKLRSNQVGAYSHVSDDINKAGFRIMLTNKAAKPTPREIEEMRMLEQFMLNTGYEHNPDRTDNFEMVQRKLVRDRLTLDAIALQLVANKMGELCEFWVMDAGTISFATEDYSVGREGTYNPIKFVQVSDSRIMGEYTALELAYGVANPTSEIGSLGYGECIPGYNKVLTSDGYIKIEELVHKYTDAKSELSVKVFNGKTFERAKAWRTGRKQLCKIFFGNGKEFHSSPDHKYLTLDEKGEFFYKELKNMSKDDVVCMSSQIKDTESETDPDVSFQYIGNLKLAQRHSYPLSIDTIDDDMYELFGWLLGDGCITVGTQKTTVSMCYNKLDERDVASRHLEVLQKYGIPAGVYEYETVPVLDIKINSRSFSEWLCYLGFPKNGGDKCVPDFIFKAQKSKKLAFLRGLYSADGCVSFKPHGTEILMGLIDEDLIRGIQLLLHSVGVRSSIQYYIDRAKNGKQGFLKAEYPIWRLQINSRDAFKIVGFIQKHKMEKLFAERNNFNDSKSRVIPACIASPFAVKILSMYSRGALGGNIYETLIKVKNGSRTISFTWLRNVIEYLGDSVELLGLYDKYNAYDYIYITGIVYEDEVVDMYDIGMVDGDPCFVCEGVVVHNSELELLVEVITSYLFSRDYNKSFFTKNSVPAGILTLTGKYRTEELDMFKRQWAAQVQGVNNAWRVPIMASEDGKGVELKTFKANNKDAEFQKWMDFLIKITAAVYQTSPEEINFSMGSSSGDSPLIAKEGGQAILASKDRGLVPLLRFLQNFYNTNIIRRINPKYQFVFTGVEPKDQEKDIDLKIKKKFFTTVNEIRATEDLPALTFMIGDVNVFDLPDNPVIINLAQSTQQAKEMKEQQDTAQAQGNDLEQPPEQDQSQSIEQDLDSPEEV